MQLSSSPSLFPSSDLTWEKSPPGSSKTPGKSTRWFKQTLYLNLAHLLASCIFLLAGLGSLVLANPRQLAGIFLANGLYGLIFYGLSFLLAFKNHVGASKAFLLIGVCLQFYTLSFLVEFNGAFQLLLVWVVILAGILFNWKSANGLGFVTNLVVIAHILVLEVWHLYKPLLILDKDTQILAFGICLSVALFLTTVGITLAVSNLKYTLNLTEREQVRVVEANRKLAEQHQSGEIICGQLVQITNHLATASKQQESGSKEQAAAVNQITASMEELSQIAFQISTNAQLVLQAASSTLQVAQMAEKTSASAAKRAEKGQKASRGTLESIRQVQSNYETLDLQLTDLSQFSENIDAMVNLITEISNETHLLALNAAIESASAGEYGERFGIVAHQTKSLADRSRKSASEINQIVGKIQVAIKTSRITAGEGLESSKEAVRVAFEAGEVLEDLAQVIEKSVQDTLGIANSAEQNKRLAEEIGITTQQQRIASQQIVSTIRDVGQVASETSSSALQVSRSAGEIEKLANHLQSTFEL